MVLPCAIVSFSEAGICLRVKYKTSVIAIPRSPRNVRIPHFTMDADQERAYSALEVVPCQRAYQESQLEISRSSAKGKEVAPDGGKQHVINGRDGVEVITKGGRFTHEHGNHYGNDRLYVRWTPRKRWVLGGAFGLIVLLAVVLGSVLGSRHKQSTTASLTNPQNSTSPSNSSAATPSAPPVQHMIAALSFTSNNVNHTRVFF